MSDWSPLPEIAGKEAELAVAVRGRFMGDSAFEYTLGKLYALVFKHNTNDLLYDFL